MRAFPTARLACGAFAAILGTALPILFSPARCACADEAAEPKVQVCGLRIVGRGYEKDDELLRAFHWRKGTTVALLVTAPDGGLIAVNLRETKVSKLADDRGTDLTVSEKGVTRAPRVDKAPQVSADGKACIIEISGQEVPAVGAAYVAVAGTVSLKCGNRKEVGRKEKVELKEGAEFTVGGMTFTVSKAGMTRKSFEVPKLNEKLEAIEPDNPTPPPFEVTLETKQDWADIANVAFLDADGKDLGAKPGAVAAVIVDKHVVAATKSFLLPHQAETATIVVTCWENYKDVDMPFDIKAMVGIP